MSDQRSPGGLRAAFLGLCLTAGVAAAAVGAFGIQVVDDFADAAEAATTAAARDPVPEAESTPSAPIPTEPASPIAPPAPSETAPQPTSPADRARELLTVVRVVSTRPNVPGYDRDCGPGDGCVFGTEWSDDTQAPLARNGCDTRNDVLARTLQDVRFAEDSPRCDVTGGTFIDPYTANPMDYASEGSNIHIDHLFPLAAAWDLGAAAWTPEERAAFANDPTFELLAVNGTANLQKGDSTPASWLPPNRAFRCAYVTSYLEVAYSYDLAVTAADVRVIEPVLDKAC